MWLLFYMYRVGDLSIYVDLKKQKKVSCVPSAILHPKSKSIINEFTCSKEVSFVDITGLNICHLAFESIQNVYTVL